MLAGKQDWDGAIPEYREALRQNSSDPDLEQKLGEALYAKGDLAGSIDAFRAAANLKPSDARVRNSLGLALCGSGDLEGAVAAYREAVNADPKYAEAYNNLAYAYAVADSKPELPEALRLATQAVQMAQRQAAASCQQPGAAAQTDQPQPNQQQR